MTMKLSETKRMWCDKLWRTFGVCGVEILLRAWVIYMDLELGFSSEPENISMFQQYVIRKTVYLAGVVLIAICFSFLCAKRGWYTQSSMRFLNIENVFSALPFLILHCCLAYHDVLDVCWGVLIAVGLCLPRVISCIAYYRRNRDSEIKKKGIARWCVMIAGMLISWAASIAIMFWVAYPQGFWGKDGAKYLWTVGEVVMRVSVPVLAAFICLCLEVWLKRSGVMQKSEWIVLLLQDLYCMFWSGVSLLIMLMMHHSSISDWISAFLVFWAILCIAAQRITSGRICAYWGQHSQGRSAS